MSLSTQFGVDVYNAIKKRTQSQGAKLEPEQIQTLALDIMATVNSDSSFAISQALTEIANNPQRPFVFGV
jgi:hypothetical protein